MRLYFLLGLSVLGASSYSAGSIHLLTDISNHASSSHSIKHPSSGPTIMGDRISGEDMKKRGMDLFGEHNYADAIKFLIKSEHLGALHKSALGDCYLAEKNYMESAKWYIAGALDEASFNIDGDNTSLIHLYSEEAFLKLNSGENDEAVRVLSQALKEKD